MTSAIYPRQPAPNFFNAQDYGAVPDAYFADGTVKGNFTVTNISTAEVITTSAPHNYEVGDWVTFSGTTSTPALSSTTPYQITVVNASDFTITGVDVTAGGASGGTVRNHTLRSATAAFVAADVGLLLTGMRIGSSSNQPNSSIVLAVPSATILTMTNAAGRTQSAVRFYLNRGGDQTTKIQAAIDAAAAAGGGTVFLPGVGYAITGLVLKNRVFLEGAGQGATTLRLLNSSNAPVVRNDYTTNNNASLGGLRNLKLLGNRARQSDVTTTLNGAYTAGSGTMTVTDASSFLPSGTVKIVNSWYRYTSKSGNVLTIGHAGIENTLDTSQSNGATVTHPVAHGIYIYRDPYNTIGTSDEQYDLHYAFDNVYIFDVKGDGFHQYGQSATKMSNCLVEYADNVGMRPSYDSMFVNLNIGNCGRFGWVIDNSQIELSNIVTYQCGGNTAADGYAYMVDGPTIIEEGTKNFSCCSAQDNKAGGWLIRNAQRVGLAACTASSNSTSSAGTYPALTIDGSTSCIIDLMCTDRTQGTATQTHAIKLLETGGITNSGLNIRLTHGVTNGTSGNGTAIDSGSVYTGGNIIISVNGQGLESVPVVRDGFLSTISLPGVAATAVTTAVNQTSYFQYIGRAPSALSTIDLVCRVTTAAVAAITWAEVGVFKGAPVANGAATLTRLGFTDVSATFNSTGIKKTTVTLTACNAGDDLWVAYGCQAAVTNFQLRGSQVDDIQSGVLQEKATTRISTVAAATAMTLSAASLVGAWFAAKI